MGFKCGNQYVRLDVDKSTWPYTSKVTFFWLKVEVATDPGRFVWDFDKGTATLNGKKCDELGLEAWASVVARKKATGDKRRVLVQKQLSHIGASDVLDK